MLLTPTNLATIKFFRLLPAAVLFVFAGGAGRASYIQLTGSSQLSADNVLATYAQPDSTAVASPFTDAIGGTAVTFSTGLNEPFTVEHQGVSFFGDFASGTPLLYNGGNGPDLLSFSQPVTQFGVTVESNVVASHLYTVTLRSGSAADLTYTFSDDGFSSFFIGAQGTGTSTFNMVSIASNDNDFAIGPVSLPAVISNTPEPASFLLLGLGSLLVVASRLRFRKGGRQQHG